MYCIGMQVTEWYRTLCLYLAIRCLSFLCLFCLSVCRVSDCVFCLSFKRFIQRKMTLDLFLRLIFFSISSNKFKETHTVL